MTEKIEWYREVLELEPNSKVFFPLAKLLVRDGDSEKAIDVLANGLERHPEFLEARLLLIELMHKNGQKQDCAAQIEKLSAMFASYAGFWEAWAACLSSQPGDADTASIIRFLAAHFISGPLQLHDVLNKGLEVILHEKANANAGCDAENAPASQPMPENSAETPANLTASQTGATPENAVTPAEPQIHTALQEDSEEISPVDDAALPMAASDDIGMEIQPSQDSGHVNEEAAPALAVDKDDDNIEAAESGQDFQEQNPEETEAASQARIMDAGEKITTSVSDNLAADVYAEEETENSAVDEPFSLRTRSMAEVLAEQGDLQGALDIYVELASSGPAPDEAADINRRIAELTSRIGRVEEEENAVVPPPAPSKSKEKLIGMLEALAQRVEARVQN